MAKEVEINYFEVTVKLQEETDQEDRAGNPKIKKWQEKWLVHAKTTEEANKIVKESSNIKNTYITQLMLECISRIERLD